MRIFVYLGVKGGSRIVMKFCIGVGVPDVITHANLGVDQFGGFWWSRGRISHFSIDFVLSSLNTLASVWCFQFLVLYTVYSSGLAVLYLSHSK